jgi:hypothetical protein
MRDFPAWYEKQLAAGMPVTPEDTVRYKMLKAKDGVSDFMSNMFKRPDKDPTSAGTLPSPQPSPDSGGPYVDPEKAKKIPGGFDRVK